MTRRDQHVTIAVSNAELSALLHAAETCGMPLALFVREMALEAAGGVLEVIVETTRKRGTNHE